MSQRMLGLLLPWLASTACVVPGLELGPAQGGAAGSAGGGGGAPTSAGTPASGGTKSDQAGSNGRTPPEPRCEDLPIPPKSAWMVAASSSSLGDGTETDPLHNPPAHAIDGTTTERWASGQPQEDGQWFHIDFGASAAISEVTLQQGTDIDDYPRAYEISLSYQHTDFDAVASATGQGASVSETVIPLAKLSVGRYMLVRQTGTAPRWWSIAELDVACH